MIHTKVHDTNLIRRERADRLWRQLLDGALRKGFYGAASIEVTVNDGTIQHIRRRTEQTDRH